MTQEFFLGREPQLEILRKRICGLRDGYRQNIALIGDELVGKTTLLCHFLKGLGQPQIIPLYIEVKDEPRPSFTKRFIAALLYNFLKQEHASPPEDLDSLIVRSRASIPKTIERIDFLIDACARRRRQGFFKELLDLTTLLYQETGKSCLIVFDEFHNLENLGFIDLYRDWCNALMTQKTTMYVIASSMKYHASEILSKNLSLLFGNFEVLTVEPFDLRTGSRYLSAAVPHARLTQGLRNFILHFTSGYPLYLKVISSAVERASAAEFPQILERLLFDTSGIFHQRFSNYIKIFRDTRNKNDYLCILHRIACGRNKINEIAHLLRLQRKDILARLNYLVSLDAISRSGDFLRINDRVFSFWLRFVYDENLQALAIDAQTQRTHFCEAVSAMIQDFSLSLEQPLAERLLDLMSGFRNEMLQFERKRIRLNQFREVKSLEFPNPRFREGIIGRSADCLWILGLSKMPLTEEDITAFAKECRRYRHNKERRRIMVTLDDQIDANTQLRALEEKIWTWDINHINFVFEVFNKPVLTGVTSRL